MRIHLGTGRHAHIPAPESPKVLPIAKRAAEVAAGEEEEEENEEDEEEDSDDDLTTFSDTSDEEECEEDTEPKPSAWADQSLPPKQPSSPVPSTSDAPPSPPHKRPSKLSLPPAKKARRTQSIQANEEVSKPPGKND